MATVHLLTCHTCESKRAQSIAQKAEQYGPKRALFQVTKESGGVCGLDSTGTLPRNESQVKYIKKKQQETGPANKDPLASVMELQKTTFRGFIREIVCNAIHRSSVEQYCQVLLPQKA